MAMTPTQQQPIPAFIESLAHDGRGIARVQGKTVFVDGALAGEQVLLRYRKRRSQYDEAEVLEVVEAAPERVTPACKHFGVCGGCSLQHMSAAQQMTHKQTILLQQLQRFGDVTPETVLPPLVGDSVGYRRRARLGVRYVIKKSRLMVGFREKQSRYLADLDECAVLRPIVGQLITPLRELMSDWPHREAIPQIEVAVADNATALIFRHMVPLDAVELAALEQFATQHNVWIYLQPGDHESIHQVYPPKNTSALHYRLPAYQVTLEFKPIDFIQVNGSMNERMIAQALSLLQVTPEDTVLDLFCGLGNFSLPLARRAKQVVGVEGDLGMVQRATQNAALNQIDNAAFHAYDLFTDFSAAVWAAQKFTKILLDPPRAGAEAILPTLAGYKASHIVYVSCDPATLARDAGLLVQYHGYSLKAVGVMDMFPQTTHVESIALFERR